MADLQHTTSTSSPAATSPQRFILSSPARTFLLSAMGLGLLCLIMIFFNDDQFHTRFWTNILHNSIFFTGISLFALFFYAANVVALGGWIVSFKRLWEAYAQFLVVGLILMLIIAGGLFFGYHHLYHWNDETLRTSDKVIMGKSGFLSKGFYTGFTILALGTWIFLAKKIRAISLDEDVNGNSGFSHHIQLRKYSSMALPLIGFMSAACIWLWVMSLDAHWYSTMFAWYSSASLFVSMLVLTIGIILYMKSRGYLVEVTTEHLHDLAKFTFAFSIFWTYLWFSQYMLIWYSNIGEETTYFRQRFDHYKILYYANLILNFLLPFLILMRNDTKRKVGTLIFVALLVFFGHWIDYFQMIKPGTLNTAHELIENRAEIGHIKPLEAKPMEVAKTSEKDSITPTAIAESKSGEHKGITQDTSKGAAMAMETKKDDHNTASAVEKKTEESEGEGEHKSESSFVTGFTLPGLLEIGVLIGFLAGFLLFVFNEVGKAPLQAKNDPYYAESLHHHVQ